MTAGKATGTASSAQLLAADAYRDHVTVMLQSAVTMAIGIGEDAVLDEGVVLKQIGDSCRLSGPAARAAINIIGNTGVVSYQTGQVDVKLNGGTPS
jgi:hypothetical protein